MNFVQRAVSAFLLLIAIVGGATMPAFSGLMHPVCAAREHDCGSTPKIAKCCCGDEQTLPTDSSPVQSRIEVQSPLLSMPAVPSAVHVAMTPHDVHNRHTPPPLRFRVDLPTLFSSLLI